MHCGERSASDSTACQLDVERGDHMEVTVEPWAPVARCYKCGSSRVVALCHHCWRPGCAKHVLASPRWVEKLFGRDGGGPGLQNVRPRHCRDCAHIRAGTAGTRPWWLVAVVAGGSLAVIGAITVSLSPIAGLILLLAGGMSATWAYLRGPADLSPGTHGPAGAAAACRSSLPATRSHRRFASGRKVLGVTS